MSYYTSYLYEHYLYRALLDVICFHKPQKDKNGDNYYKHPIAVAGYFFQERDIEAAIVALLHDLVEDTPVTMDYIYNQYPTSIAKAVDAMTRREEETYRQYTRRCIKNPLARRVKKQDVLDNLRPERMFKDAPLERYYKTLAAIRGKELEEEYGTEDEVQG